MTLARAMKASAGRRAARRRGEVAAPPSPPAPAAQPWTSPAQLSRDVSLETLESSGGEGG